MSPPSSAVMVVVGPVPHYARQHYSPVGPAAHASVQSSSPLVQLSHVNVLGQGSGCMSNRCAVPVCQHRSVPDHLAMPQATSKQAHNFSPQSLLLTSWPTRKPEQMSAQLVMSPLGVGPRAVVPGDGLLKLQVTGSVAPPATLNQGKVSMTNSKQSTTVIIHGDTAEDCFPGCLDAVAEPYKEMLEVLFVERWLSSVPVDVNGTLNVAVPFCGPFTECTILVDFLERVFLNSQRPDVKRISILGTDINRSCYWDAQERYINKKHRQVNLQLRQMDLTSEAMPECGLCLGMHPECSVKTDIWMRIFQNVWRSVRPNGVCIISTFFPVEREATAQMFAALGATSQVVENPYWVRNPVPESPKPSYNRFIIRVCRDSSGRLASMQQSPAHGFRSS